MHDNLPRAGSGDAPTVRRRWLIAVFAVLGVSAAFTSVASGDVATPVAVLAMTLGLSVTGWLLLRDSRAMAKAEGRAWRLLGTGLLIAAAGIVIHAGAWFVVGDVPTFGPLDLFWLVGYALGTAGVAMLPHTGASRWQRARLLLDGLIGAIAIGALLWAMKLQHLAADLNELSIWSRTIGTSYVLLDVGLLIVLVTVVIKRSTYRFDRRLVFIGLALLAQGGADYVFLTNGVGRTFNEVVPVFPLHIIASAMFLAAAATVSKAPEPREYADRATAPAWSFIVPHSLAAVLVGLLLISVPESGYSATDKVLLPATVLLGCLMLTRQAVAINESRRSIDHHRSVLAASISHELRTPLTTMVGFLELLDAEAFPNADERREATSLVSSQANYMATMVTDILMLASDGEESMDLQITATPVADLVGHAIIDADIDPSLARTTTSDGLTAFVDEGRIRQAVANLLSNAARYGGGQIEIVALANSGDLLLEVHDDGPGVSPKHELMIWEKFERGPNRFNAATPGSGIGLAITGAIAAAHGGMAGYKDSERLGGACFWMTLPGRVEQAGSPGRRDANDGAPPQPLRLVGGSQALGGVVSSKRGVKVVQAAVEYLGKGMER